MAESVLLDFKAEGLEKFVREIEKASVATSKLNDEVDEFSKQKPAPDPAPLKRQIGLVEKLEKELEDLRKAQKQAYDEKDVVKYNKRIEETERRLDRLNKAGKKTEGVGKIFGKLGVAAGAFGVALGGAFAVTKLSGFVQSAVKDFATFDASIKELASITGLAGEDLDNLADSAKRLALTSTQSSADVLTAFKLIGSAKPELLSNAEALEQVTASAITLAEASGLDVSTAATQLGNALNALQLPAEEAGSLINVLAAASQKGAKEIPFVTDALSKFGGVAQSAGVSVEESVAAVETLGKAIPEASIVGTNLRNILIKLQVDASKSGREFVSLSDELERLAPDVDNVAALTEKFGDRNLLAVQTLIKQRDELSKLQTDITGTNTAYEQAEIQANSLEAIQKQLANTLEVIRIELGERLAPILVPIIKNLTAFGQAQLNIETRSKAVQVVIDLVRASFEQFRQALQVLSALGQANLNLFGALARAFGVTGDNTEILGKTLKGLQSVLNGINDIVLGLVGQFTALINGIAGFIDSVRNGVNAVRNWITANLRLFNNSVELVEVTKEQTTATEELSEATAKATTEADLLTDAEKKLIDEYSKAINKTKEYTADTLSLAEAWKAQQQAIEKAVITGKKLQDNLKAINEKLEETDVRSVAFQNLLRQALQAEKQIQMLKQTTDLTKLRLQLEDEDYLEQLVNAEQQFLLTKTLIETEQIALKLEDTEFINELAQAQITLREYKDQLQDAINIANTRLEAESIFRQTQQDIKLEIEIGESLQLAKDNLEGLQLAIDDLGDATDAESVAIRESLAQALGIATIEVELFEKALADLQERLKKRLEINVDDGVVDVELNIDGLTTGIEGFREKVNSLKDELDRGIITQEEYASELEQLAKRYRDVRDNTGELTKDQKALIDAYISGAGLTEIYTDDTEKYTRAVLQAAEATKELSDEEKKRQKEQEAADKKAQADKLQAEADALDLLVSKFQEVQDLTGLDVNIVANIESEFAKIDKLVEEGALDDLEAGILRTGQGLDATAQFATSLFEARFAKLEKLRNEGKISEEEFARKSAQIAREQAIFDKQVTISKIILANALAIAENAGNPFKIAIVAAIGAAQLAIALAQPIPPLPQFAEGTKGTMKAPRGWALVGEEGPELVQLRGGEKIFTNRDSMEISRILSKYNVPVALDGPYETVSKPFNDMTSVFLQPSVAGVNVKPLVSEYKSTKKTLAGKLDILHQDLQEMKSIRYSRLNARI